MKNPEGNWTDYLNEVGEDAFDVWLETLSPEQIAYLKDVIEDDEPGVRIVEDDEAEDAPEEQEEKMMDQPKAEKTKCRCCGFAKKARRVNAEGICKVCYVALVTSNGNEVTVVGRQGLKGRNTVSVVVGGVRVKVRRKVRLDS